MATRTHTPEPRPPVQSPPTKGGVNAVAADPPVETVRDEQIKRSEEIEAMGVDPWKASQEEGARVVPGVSGADPNRPGTPTTPPEGHDRREPAPGEPGGPTAGHYPMPDEPKPEVRQDHKPTHER